MKEKEKYFWNILESFIFKIKISKLVNFFNKHVLKLPLS